MVTAIIVQKETNIRTKKLRMTATRLQRGNSRRRDDSVWTDC
jgi:hypothetical protein